MINVPHAFTPEYPCDDREPPPCKVPVILNAYDSYMFKESVDLVVDVSEAFELMVEMSCATNRRSPSGCWWGGTTWLPSRSTNGVSLLSGVILAKRSLGG